MLVLKVSIFIVKRPMQSRKRKEVLKKCFIFDETLPVPGKAVPVQPAVPGDDTPDVDSRYEYQKSAENAFFIPPEAENIPCLRGCKKPSPNEQ